MFATFEMSYVSIIVQEAINGPIVFCWVFLYLGADVGANQVMDAIDEIKPAV